MHAGMMEVTLRLEGNASLKGKRKVVKSILGRVKARFNVAASEVGGQDVYELAVLGFAVCGPDRRILNTVLDNILDFIEDNADAEVVDSEMEFDLFFGAP
ncbi:MAG: DUF503 domain-containing protein [Candidatus Adiutrix sp.]|jgi:uncharacterized protein YlxP (DUF503 family)|nr:DUF503 domain-containing protein [Candidatus Adiutrix sp.]